MSDFHRPTDDELVARVYRPADDKLAALTSYARPSDNELVARVHEPAALCLTHDLTFLWMGTNDGNLDDDALADAAQSLENTRRAFADATADLDRATEQRRAEAAKRGLQEVLDDPEPDTWHYISFADSTLPEGSQFLGGIYVRGATIEAALTRSHLLGINPGGEASCVGPIPGEQIVANVAVGDRERLLSREEVEH